MRALPGHLARFTGLAFVLALAAVKLLLPPFSAFTGKTLHLTFGSGLQVWLGLLAIIVFVGLASGLYPGLVLSAFPAVSSLKYAGPRKGGFRRGIVVFQFAVSVIFIIGFIQAKDLPIA